MIKSLPDRYKTLAPSFTYFATFITLGATMALIGPSLPWLTEHTSSRLDQISLIFVTNSMGYMIGSLFGGRAYDRFPGHRLQSLALLLICIGAAAVPVLRSLWFLVGVVFLLGFFQGALDVGCNTLLTWIHGKQVGPFMNGLHFFFGLGSFIAPLIFASVVSAVGEIHWSYWIFSLATLPVVLWLWILPSPEIRRRDPEAVSGKPKNGLFVLIIFFFIFSVGLELGFGNWIYTFSYRLDLASKTGAAYLTSAFWGAFSISRLLGIWIASRLKPQVILGIDLAGCLIAFSILLFFPVSIPALWCGTILMGISVASIFATAMAYAEQRLHLTGTMVGWILVGGGIGGMLSPWIIGQLFESISPRITMPVLLVNNLIAISLLIIMLLPGKDKASKLIFSSTGK